MFWKDGLSKKLSLEYYLSCITGKIIFLLLENMILFFGRKIKNGLSQKNTRKYEIFLKCSGKRLSFQKNIKYFVLIFWCCIDTINHIALAFTSYNSVIAPLLVNCFLKYREIALAENGLLWILNKLRSVLLKNCSENWILQNWELSFD